MTMLLTSMIALLVFFIAAATDHPYCGVSAIGPAAYEVILHDLMEAENN